ncbi:MAG: DUF1851 domain-containing protein [Oscillospiraceae bacterium]|nr:DUF1851 domain-containing protein [Oscillospiraceae bacterium]
MDENAIELFKNSIKYADVPEEVIEKYRGRVPDDFISLWREYGFCTTEDGYYKIVNPDDYADIWEDLFENAEDAGTVVVMVTAMADLIFYDSSTLNSTLFYDNNSMLCYADIRHQNVHAICDDFSMTMGDMRTYDFRSDELSWDLYEKAVQTLGVPAYDECFGYEPLLSLGGKEKVENLRKVNLMVHLDIVSQMQDPAEW